MRIDDKKISGFGWERIRQPLHYIPLEHNLPRKELNNIRLRIALAFPDTYPIGMSNYGFKLVYTYLNKHPDIYAERFFMPGQDMRHLMEAKNIPLCSLETMTPMARFDFIAFSLHYELAFTSVLKMLSLGHVPIKAQDREDRLFPVVMAGGPVTCNAEPLAEFFDFFVIGEIEEIVDDLCKKLIEVKLGDYPDKESALSKLAQLPGIYVPRYYEPIHADPFQVREFRLRRADISQRPGRMVARNPSNFFLGGGLITPTAQVIHDRSTVEVARGCPQGCRFCQAGYIYRPYREKPGADIQREIEDRLSHEGCDEISLLSLSIGDYHTLESLVKVGGAVAGKQHTSLSFPSLRPGALSLDMLKRMQQVRKAGFTLAPEAGSQRLRDIINKKISEQQILDDADKVFAAGWQGLKLYFMFGLPLERMEDLDEMMRLSREIFRIGRSYHSRKAWLNITLSPFVPKPHTPFQWHPMDAQQVLQYKLDYLINHLKDPGISLKWHQPPVSTVEGFLSRGSRLISEAIVNAYNRGACLEAWSENFDMQPWNDSLAEAELQLEPFLYVMRDRDCLFPWDIIDPRLDKDYLYRDYLRAMRGITSEQCPVTPCEKCGACDLEEGIVIKITQENDAKCDQRQAFQGDLAPQGTYRYRLFYCKVGLARYMGHIDMVTAFQRAFRRAGIRIAYSKGFNPHPRFSFIDALPVGMEAKNEIFELFTGQTLSDTELKKVNKELPDGLLLLSLQEIPKNAPRLSKLVQGFQYRVTFKADADGLFNPNLDKSALREKLIDFADTDSKAEHTLKALSDLRLFTEEHGLSGYEFTLLRGEKLTMKPYEIARALTGSNYDADTRIILSRLGFLPQQLYDNMKCYL